MKECANLIITVNGQTKQITQDATLAMLLRELALQGERVAVECNEQIVPQTDFDSHLLREGDTLEIVRFVGGG